MQSTLSYKTYCWNMGTTSFRPKQLNLKIEQQLLLLERFWNNPRNKHASWASNKELQQEYYTFLKDNAFLTGDAAHPDKDAREKTSGLVELGLLDENRRISHAGKALLTLCKTQHFQSSNYFQIPEDSYIYLRQLLKTSYSLDSAFVRPFIILVWAVAKLRFISFHEMAYLLPFCTNREASLKILAQIQSLRLGLLSIDDVILSRILSMENYKIALRNFLDSKQVTVQLLCKIGFNRKSREYDRKYFDLYSLLHALVFSQDENVAIPIFNALKLLPTKKFWREFLFKSQRITLTTLKRQGRAAFKSSTLLNASNETQFRTEFFKLLHLFKARFMLDDYMDLNKRYFSMADIFIFENNTVYFDIIPEQIFTPAADQLFDIAFTQANNLLSNCTIQEITPFLILDKVTLFSAIQNKFNVSITSVKDIKKIISNQKLYRFNKFIQEHFSNSVLLSLLEDFERRNDAHIFSLVTDNADIPTIFEYVISIIWHKISGLQENILEWMNLSLDANLLPKTHAAGGQADIICKYDKTQFYPEHALLIEVTLTDASNQRRLEMEPVSRHLGEFCLRNEKLIVYSLFITTHLDRNVVSDFRNRKSFQYFNKNSSKCVSGFKIIPLETQELKTILKAGMQYKQLYQIFDDAYSANTPIPQWYRTMIQDRINISSDNIRECKK